MPRRFPVVVRASRAAFIVSMVVQTYLLYVFSTPDAQIDAPANSDKFVHMAMFGGPAMFALLGRWRWAALALVAYAPISELIQSTALVGRDGDWRDAAADVSGIIVVAVVARSLGRRAVT